MINLNQPLEPFEAGVLANVDELVEMGIPRDMADRCVRLAIDCRDVVYDQLDRIDYELSDFNDRTLAKSLLTGELYNWGQSRAEFAKLALLLIAAQYRGN